SSDVCSSDLQPIIRQRKFWCSSISAITKVKLFFPRQNDGFYIEQCIFLRNRGNRKFLRLINSRSQSFGIINSRFWRFFPHLCDLQENILPILGFEIGASINRSSIRQTNYI